MPIHRSPQRCLALALIAATWGASSVHAEELLIKVDPSVNSIGPPHIADVVRRLVDRLDVIDLNPVFPEPPRGWSDAAAARKAGLDRWWLVELEGSIDDFQIEQLAERADVEWLGLNREMRFFDTTPNDPRFGQQWALQNGIMNAPQAWDTTTQSDVIVAVLDSGVDLNHEDLDDARWVNTGEIASNGIDDDGNGYIDDRKGWDFADDDRRPEDALGHGTHTSGTVGAEGNNGLDVTGVAWTIPVMTLKIGSFGIDWNDAAEGVVYAADNGAQVISMSWGDSVPIPVVEDAIDYAVDLDVLPVAAAGNNGNQARGYPAAYNKVMAVIATNARDRRANFSTHGAWCDLSAPGEDILSLRLGGGTVSQSGTSMACPHVAGVAGMIRHLNPDLDWVDTRWALNLSAVDLGSPGKDNDFGYGRLDLERAMEFAQRLRVSTTTVARGGSVTLSLEQRGAAGFRHILLAGISGRRQGTELAAFDPADPRRLPLNYDAALMPLILTSPTGAGIFDNFVGDFDASGQSTATFFVPRGTFFEGRRVGFAYLSFDPSDLTRIDQVSSSIAVDVQ